MTIGERIKEYRINFQLTQEELAKKIGSTKQTIYKYENNIITSIPLEKVALIAKAFGIAPMELMGWDMTSLKKSEKSEEGFYSILSDIFTSVTKINTEGDISEYLIQTDSSTNLILSEETLYQCYNLMRDMIPRTISFLVTQEDKVRKDRFISNLGFCGASIDETFHLQKKYDSLLNKARTDIDTWNKLDELEIDLLNTIKNPKFQISKIHTREEAMEYFKRIWNDDTTKTLHLEEMDDKALIDYANGTKASCPYID